MRIYWDATPQPLYCLLFLFPLVATYEFGALMLRPFLLPERQLVAHSLIDSLLGLFGAAAFWLPGVALLLTLLIWHILQRQSWQVRGWVLPLMLVESVVLVVPLFVLNRALLQAGGPGPSALRLQIVLALGAGVFEELVFRLYLITGLMFLLVHLTRVPRRYAGFAAIGLAAVVFSLCHVEPIGAEAFAWHSFGVRALAGVYLGGVFVGRGLGVATGCHVAYNLVLLGLGASGAA